MNDSGYVNQLDQLNIETPEQVDLLLPVAGIGSRFIAILVDTVLQVVAELVLILIFVLLVSASQRERLGDLSDTSGKWLVATLFLFHFLLFWGYFALFEAFWNGQTPGKRLINIRVIKDSGRQITLFEALARNLLRVVDMIPPNFYLVGIITMLCNRQQKRLGDFVAGTIVIHERTSEQPLLGHNSLSITASVYPQTPVEHVPRVGGFQLPADAVARLKAEDLNVIESFLARALDLDPSTRATIASRIAATMFAKMNLPLPPEVIPERALEAVSHLMRSQARV
jgi:uncharacterized RDD family membrane protein YckC